MLNERFCVKQLTPGTVVLADGLKEVSTADSEGVK